MPKGAVFTALPGCCPILDGPGHHGHRHRRHRRRHRRPFLGMAAHLEGKGAAMIDMVGLSQKNGAVVTHLRIAAPEDIAAVRIAAGGADLILGCDLVAGLGTGLGARASDERTRRSSTPTRRCPRNSPAMPTSLPAEGLRLKIGGGRQPGAATIDATRIATALLGNSIATNLFTLGYAYQLGLIPVTSASIEQAIRLNGAAVKMNLEAFLWGRRAAHDLDAVEAISRHGRERRTHASLESLDDARARARAF